MKKIVPDPPKLTSQPFYTINPDMPSVDALTHTLQLMSGIEDTLDEYICANAGEPGINMLVNAVHHVQMTKALAKLLLHRQPPQGPH